MTGAPEGTPPHWLAYFLVPDADAAVASASAAGGGAFGEPFDTPYGRMAGITDRPAGSKAATWPISGELGIVGVSASEEAP